MTFSEPIVPMEPPHPPDPHPEAVRAAIAHVNSGKGAPDVRSAHEAQQETLSVLSTEVYQYLEGAKTDEMDAVRVHKD